MFCKTWHSPNYCLPNFIDFLPKIDIYRHNPTTPPALFHKTRHTEQPDNYRFSVYSISDDTDAKFVLAALFSLHDNDVYSFGFERVIERYPHTVFPIDRPVNDLYGIKIISGNINISVIRQASPLSGVSCVAVPSTQHCA